MNCTFLIDRHQLSHGLGVEAALELLQRERHVVRATELVLSDALEYLVEGEGAERGEADGEEEARPGERRRAGVGQVQLQLKYLARRLGNDAEAGRLDDDELPLEEVQHHLAVEERTPTYLGEVVGHRRLGIFLVLPGRCGDETFPAPLCDGHSVRDEIHDVFADAFVESRVVEAGKEGE